jgi:hypothetical protein
LKEEENPLVIAGDGRHDSMGHSAKYGIFCCTIPLIIHFSLTQVKMFFFITQKDYYNIECLHNYRE